MLRAESLRVGEKSFAYLGEDGLVLKLPRPMIDVFERDGQGSRLRVGSRVMREWIVLSPASAADWAKLIEHAYWFVRDGLPVPPGSETGLPAEGPEAPL